MDSNHRPQAYETCKLTTALSRYVFVREVGLEPTNEARAEDELARIMPCKEEEDGVNLRSRYDSGVTVRPRCRWSTPEYLY